MQEVGFQLSSIAPYLDTAEHLKASLMRVADIGYRRVQLQGVSPAIPDTVIAAALRENGLRCIAAQEDYPTALHKDPDRAIGRAAACGSRYFAFSLIPPACDTPDRLKGFAKKLLKICDKVEKAGMIFAYHPTESDFRIMGKTPVYERLLSQLPPEVQLSFCVHASFGRIPYARVLEQYAGRTDLVHFKDSVTRADGTPLWMPLGEGEHNWKPVLNACDGAGVKYIFAKQEHWDRDAFDCAKMSYRYLLGLGL